MPKTTLMRPTIAISMGDPAGIGPEIALAALSDPSIRRLARWILVGTAEVLTSFAGSRVGGDMAVVRDEADLAGNQDVSILDEQLVDLHRIAPRAPDASCGKASLIYVRRAVELCLAGVADAMVTGPVSKEAVALSGRRFTGHTEYIAELCGVHESRMLLVNDRLRVVHVTTHCAFSEVADIKQQRVLDTIVIGHEAVLALGVERPRIAVCGLNPHAGENGLFGNQESSVITPAIIQAQAMGIDCTGPYPADTLFLNAYRGRYDLVTAMYHDQGHIPMKLLDFEHTVNISLGLPIIRTSVDHGTAFDIAGKGVADPSDMMSAMKFAAKMALARRAARCNSK